MTSVSPNLSLGHLLGLGRDVPWVEFYQTGQGVEGRVVVVS